MAMKSGEGHSLKINIAGSFITTLGPSTLASTKNAHTYARTKHTGTPKCNQKNEYSIEERFAANDDDAKRSDENRARSAYPTV